MKKMISMALCLTLVFSVCSFTLTANAESGMTWRYYSFNDDSFYVTISQDIYKSNCQISITEIEGYYGNKKGIIDGGDGDLEYIIEEFLPTVYTSYQRSITTSLTFRVNNYPSPDNFLNENGIAYIISELNLTNLQSFGIDDIWSKHQNTDVKSMTPIIDALYSTCKNTLKYFSIRYYSGITEIDDRLFTDFPSIEYVNLDGCVNSWGYDDAVKISIDQYDYPHIFIKVTPDMDENVIVEQYGGDTLSFIRDYYYDIIHTHFVADENITMEPYINSVELKVQCYYNCNNIKAYIGTAIDVELVWEGDATGDQYVDAFDIAMVTEYVNSFEDPEDSAVMAAMDVVADGYIDATDLAYINYIANFEG